jgi:hypothetical protein
MLVCTLQVSRLGSAAVPHLCPHTCSATDWVHEDGRKSNASSAIEDLTRYLFGVCVCVCVHRRHFEVEYNRMVTESTVGAFGTLHGLV